MKIFMTGDGVGGVWTYALDLARALEPYGVEVTLAAMGGPLADSQRRDAAGVPNLRVFESDYKLLWMTEPWDDVRRAGDWLPKLAAAAAPDVVHLNDFGHGALDWPAPVLLVGHSCVLSWWQAVRREPAPAEWQRYRAVVAAAVARADLIAAPTQAMLDAFDTHYGPLGASRVIYNGRDPTHCRGRAKQPLVLSAGRLWDEAKNVALLARITPRLDWPVYVAGNAQPPAGQTPSFPAVRLLGPLSLEALAEWYGRAAIYALPARYEPFGLSALEAALAGCALVLGDIPTLREVWGDAACFVPPDDEEGWVSAINWLADDEGLRARWARRARARAERYLASRMAVEYMEAYETLSGRAVGQASVRGATVGTAGAQVAETLPVR